MENEQGEKNKPTFWRAPSIVKVKSVGILPQAHPLVPNEFPSITHL